MKKTLTILSLVLGQLSFGAGEFVPVYQCSLVPGVVQQANLEVNISDSGYAGITQAVVTHGISGKMELHRYFLRHEVDSQSVLYVGNGTRGQNFELSIFTDRFTPEGGMVGVLLLDSDKKEIDLSCRFIGGEVNLDN